jgi:hypothetical protein
MVGIAMSQYFRLLDLVYKRGGKIVYVDVIVGGFDRAVNAVWPLRIAHKWIVHSRTLSYKTDKEQFESVRLYVRIMYWMMRIYAFVCWLIGKEVV